MSPSLDSLLGGHHVHLAQRRQHHRRGLRPQHHSLSRLVRAGAKHLVEGGKTDVFPDCHHDHNQLDQASLRPHIQQHLRQYYCFNLAQQACRRDQIPKCNASTPRKLDGRDDGRDLAYSDVVLPSDRHRLPPSPTLKREDAFRDPSTSKIHLRRRVEHASEDEQVAGLYGMGLLYDNDEQDPGGGDCLDLNSIRHDEALYPIRPARRTRKQKVAHGAFRDAALQLDLSFSDLGDDAVVAQYLTSLNRLEAGEAIQHAPREPAESQPRLRVIYELSTSQPSFDIDTSQPPDLVVDILSDYDCFSDGELDDTPPQREIQENADNPPAEAWVILGDDS
ncbi:uncharacterized protein MAM_02582 [Metarhizium album ARSEF 1941]|uniref:Uncharacterized protein n=1 Tax=Metarhizium album (strain ARSEF 1941) TaxID=1081103 RepID=A0A0B2X1K3_METAS|nr:uncharacterized protein MAM_02582 [Metarhizium album ARSEF 1941]KHN99729.1 hypothetical protein MAM_02582 [Metarhizium album ARSEF 1941]